MILDKRPGETQDDRAKRIEGLVEERFTSIKDRHDKMDSDYKLYRLDPFKPDPAEGISQADAYTTNRPRVVADVVLSTISLTDLIIRVPEDTELNEQSRTQNDNLEALCIGMLRNADESNIDRQEPKVQDALAWYCTVRGFRVAARALLRKRPDGSTQEDILPLDPRHLFIERGDDGPLWAAYRMYRTRAEIRGAYDFTFADEPVGVQDDDDTIETAFDIYWRIPRKADPLTDDPENPFVRHPWTYLNAVVIDGQWAKKEHPVYTLAFPIVAVPIDQMPTVASWRSGANPTSGSTSGFDATISDVGESIFVYNRDIWAKQNRGLTYAMHLLGKQADPQKKVFSADGTATLGEGANEKGAEIPLSVANQEDAQLFEQPDLARSAQIALQAISQDETIGSLPPHTLGFIDQPLSSVALRQIGTTLRQRIEPRMRAVQMCIERCLKNMAAQFETGAFQPIRATGRLHDRTPFNKVITPEMITGHGVLEVKLNYQPPEDETLRWNVATMAAAPQPGFGGQPLGSLRWIRETVLGMQSSDAVEAQNVETQARFSLPVAQAMEVFKAAQKTGDEHLIAIAYDQLQLAALQHTVQTNMMMQQLMQLSQGIMPGQPPSPNGAGPNNQGTPPAMNGQVRNPGMGAPPNVLNTGMGNAPSPEAGYNTTATRTPENTRLAAIGLERTV